MAQKSKSTSVERRKDLETLIAWSKEVGADERSLITLLLEVARNSTQVGYDSESVCMKVEEGKVALNQKFPAVAVAAYTQIYRIVKDIRDQLDSEPPLDPVIQVVINRKRLEDTIETSDDD
jgi:hypothetical protein